MADEDDESHQYRHVARAGQEEPLANFSERLRGSIADRKAIEQAGGASGSDRRSSDVQNQHIVWGKVEPPGAKSSESSSGGSDFRRQTQVTLSNAVVLESSNGSRGSSPSSDKSSRRVPQSSQLQSDIPLRPLSLSSKAIAEDGGCGGDRFQSQSSSSSTAIRPRGDDTGVADWQAVLHASDRCFPCYYMSTRSKCTKGADCNFCHLQHDTYVKKPRPCKAKRAQCRRMANELENLLTQNKDEFFEKASNLLQKGGYVSLVTRSRIRCLQAQARSAIEDPSTQETVDMLQRLMDTAQTSDTSDVGMDLQMVDPVGDVLSGDVVGL